MTTSRGRASGVLSASGSMRQKSWQAVLVNVLQPYLRYLRIEHPFADVELHIDDSAIADSFAFYNQAH